MLCTLAGGGVHVASSADKPGLPVPQLHASVKKVVSLLDGPRTVLSTKAWVNVDSKAKKVRHPYSSACSFKTLV